MTYDYDERYDSKVDHSPRQRPVISDAEYRRIREEYYTFHFIQWLMRPYEGVNSLMDFHKGVYSFIKF